MESWFRRPVVNASPMLYCSPKCSTCLTLNATLILCLVILNSIFKLNAFDWRFSKLFKERLQKIIKIMYLLKKIVFFQEYYKLNSCDEAFLPPLRDSVGDANAINILRVLKATVDSDHTNIVYFRIFLWIIGHDVKLTWSQKKFFRS